MASSPAAPPSAAEVQRKLSVHAQSPPSHRRRTSLSKSPTITSALGGESDTDNPNSGALSPVNAHASFELPVVAQPQPQGTPAQQHLAAIAERPGGSGEDSEDDDDDEEWGHQPSGRSLEELQNLTDENMVKEGYLLKKGERRKTWKKRWFVLRQTQLSYYKSNKEYKLLRLLPVSEIHCVTLVTLKKHVNTFGIITPARTYYVQAESAAEAESWIKALNEARNRLHETKPPGQKHVPPTINVQRTASIPTGNEPRTPPPMGASASPSSPIHPQHHLTSSDSEDQADYGVPGSPQTQPSAVPPDPHKIVAQGYLMKCGSKRKNWRKRWFVLTSDRLVYAKSHMDKPGKKDKYVPVSAMLDAVEYTMPKHEKSALGLPGSVPIGASNSVPGSSLGGPSASASMTHSATMQPGMAGQNGEHPQLAHTFKIVTTKRALLLCAPSEEEEIKWLSAVRALIARTTGINTSAIPGVKPPIGGTLPLSSSPNKRMSRRELNASLPTSGSPPRGGEFAIPPPTTRRKDSTSFSGAATAMAIPAGSA